MAALEGFSGIAAHNVSLIHDCDSLGSNRRIFIIGVGLSALVCILGIVCNILVMVVFWSEKPLRSTSYLLLWVAFADNISLLHNLLLYVIPSFHPFTGIAEDYFWVSSKISLHTWAIGSIANSLGIYLVIFVSLDRYVAVCKPVKSKEFCTIQKWRPRVLGLVVACILYNSPRFFDATTIGYNNCSNSSTTHAVCFVYDVKEGWELYNLVYRFYLQSLTFNVFPIVILVFFNVSLICFLRRRAGRLPKRSSGNGKRNKAKEKNVEITIVVIVIVSLMIMTALPSVAYLVFNIFRANLPPDVLMFERYFRPTANAFFLLNSALNFFVYGLFGSHFRQRLKVLLCRCCPRQQWNKALLQESSSNAGLRNMEEDT
ncbi:FMRFamide receptor-like [Lingula anatina]|uniref:FMRFamide receptor-like n=1 Tax=Lingula anatina TaxID=7574 RepID=A0A1S3HZU4_LINAN|nr:FMRFamide receptor-like [Lingula anatina]|eukprot:XP_013391537.1 FMRFamide receptor-like [Lingula anatina]